MEFYLFSTPLGTMAGGEEEGVLLQIYLPYHPFPRRMPYPTPLLSQLEQQIGAYLAGERMALSLPHSVQGSPLEQKVWREVSHIPYGQTCFLDQLSHQLDIPLEGLQEIIRRNPLPILFPCHRVVHREGTPLGEPAQQALAQILLTQERERLQRGS